MFLVSCHDTIISSHDTIISSYDTIISSHDTMKRWARENEVLQVFFRTNPSVFSEHHMAVVSSQSSVFSSLPMGEGGGGRRLTVVIVIVIVSNRCERKVKRRKPPHLSVEWLPTRLHLCNIRNYLGRVRHTL